MSISHWLPTPIDIALIVLEDASYASRVRKEARSLARYGWRVVVFAVTRRGYDLPAREDVDGYILIRLSVPRWFRAMRLVLRGRLWNLVGIPVVMIHAAKQLGGYDIQSYLPHDFPALVQLLLMGMPKKPCPCRKTHPLGE